MKVVYHGNYFTWMEVGRTEFLRHLGLPYVEVEKLGIYFPVIEASCKYLKPAKYDDQIIIETQVDNLSAVRVIFRYKIYHEEGEKKNILAKGQTIHAFVNNDGRPVNVKKVPELYEKILQATKSLQA